MKTIFEKHGFDTSLSIPIFVLHTFAEREKNLEHYTNGELRCTVSSENALDYLDSINLKHVLTEKDKETILEHLV